MGKLPHVPGRWWLEMLIGEYSYAIDDKGRLNFPPKFREAMGGTFIVTDRKSVV